MNTEQKQVLIKEQIGSESKIFDAASVRELLAKNGASYTLLDGSSMSPIPFVEGRQVGSDLEIILPDGTSIFLFNYFGNMSNSAHPQLVNANFDDGTTVYFADYSPTASLSQARFDYGFGYSNAGLSTSVLPFLSVDGTNWALPAAAGLLGAAVSGDSSTVIATPAGYSVPATSGTNTDTSNTTNDATSVDSSKSYVLDVIISESVQDDVTSFTLQANTILTEGATIQLQFDGQLYSTDVDTDGQAILQIPALAIEKLAAGDIAYKVKAIDAEGHVLQQLNGAYEFIALTANDTPDDTPDDSAQTLGTIHILSSIFSESASGDFTLDVDTKLTDGDMIQLQLDGQLYSTDVDTDGKAILEIPASAIEKLAAGDVAYKVKAIDADGQVLQQLNGSYEFFAAIDDTSDPEQPSGTSRNVLIESVLLPEFDADTTSLKIVVTAANTEQGDKLYINVAGTILGPVSILDAITSINIPESVLNTFEPGVEVPFSISIKSESSELLADYQTYISSPVESNLDTNSTDHESSITENKIYINSANISKTVTSSGEYFFLNVSSDLEEESKIQILIDGQLFSSSINELGQASLPLPQELVNLLDEGSISYQIFAINTDGILVQSFNSNYTFKPVQVENTANGSDDLAPESRKVSIEGLQISPIVDDNSSVTMTVSTANSDAGDKLYLNFAGHLLGPVTIVGDITSIQVPASVIAMMAEGTTAQFSLSIKDVNGELQTSYASAIDLPVLDESDAATDELSIEEATRLALMIALISAINNLGGNGFTSSLPVISSITTTFGTSISADEAESSAVVTVNTSGISDGETITLSFAGLTYSAQVETNKASFAIPALDMQALEEGSFIATATLESDSTISKTLNVLIDLTAPEFTSQDDPIETQVDENIPITTIVETALATDVNAITYSINGDDAALLSINPITGELRFRNSPDFEVKDFYSLNLVATDSAGNAAERALEINVLDIEPENDDEPRIPTVAVGNVSDVLPTIAGTAIVATNEQLTVAINGAVFNVTPDQNGNWSLDLGAANLDIVSGTNAELQEGVIYDVIATVTNPQTEQSTSDITDAEVRVAPRAPTIDPIDVAVIEYPVITGRSQLLNENLSLIVTISQGIFPDNSVVEYEVIPFESQDDPDNYVWTLDLATAKPLPAAGNIDILTLPLIDGEYSVTARIAMLIDGEEVVSSEPGVEDFTVDITAPDAPTLELTADTNISADGITSDATVDVSGLEANATWEYSVNGGTDWTTGNGTSFEVPEGTYADGNIKVRQTDVAGNVSTIGALTGALTVDLTPVVTDSLSNELSPIISGTANLKAAETLSVSILNGDDQIIATYENVAVDNSAWSIDLSSAIAASGEWQPPAEGLDTSYKIVASVPESELSSDGTLTIDQVSPTVKLWIDTTETLTESNVGLYKLNLLFSETLSVWPPDFSKIQLAGVSLAEEPVVDPLNPLKFTVGMKLDEQFQGVGSAVVPSDTLTDFAGNSLELLELFNPSVDTVLPEELVLTIADTGTSDADGITSSNLLQVSGLEKFAVLHYSLDSGETYIEKMYPEGGWAKSSGSYITTIVLPEGGLTADQIKAYQVDQSGNVGNTSSLFLDRDYVIDRQDPYFDEMIVSYVIDENNKADVTIVAKLDPSAVIDWSTLDLNDASAISLSNLVGDPSQATLVVPTDTTGVISELVFQVQGASVADTTVNIAPVSVYLDSLIIHDPAGNEISQFSSIDDKTTLTYNVGASILGIDDQASVMRPDGTFNILSFAAPDGAKLEFVLEGYEASPLVAAIDKTITSAGYLGQSVFDLTEITGLTDATLDNTNLNYTVRMLDATDAVIAAVTSKTGTFTFDSTPPTAPIFVDADGAEITGGQIDLLENQPYQTTLFFIAKSDDTSSITYELSAEDQQYFKINPDTGGVSIRQDENSGLWQFDFESLVPDSDGSIDQDTKQITLTVNAVDAAGNIGASANINVRIGNLDESAPIFQADATAEDDFDAVRVVEEYVEDGALVYSPGEVTDFFDDDTSRDVSDSVVFTLARTGDWNLLSVDSDTGNVTINSSPEFDVKSNYSFTLVATGADGKVSTQDVRLDVNPSGTAANFLTLKAKDPITGDLSPIELSELRASLGAFDENIQLDNYEWEIRVDDPTAVLTLLDGAEDWFVINQLTATPEYWELRFKPNVQFDYETLASMNFRIRATDTDGVPKDLPLGLSVNDDGLNPILDAVSEFISTPEVLAGEELTSITAQLGSGVTGNIEYSILESNIPFAINATTGLITVTETLDFENLPNNPYTLTLRASNGGEFTDKSLTISVSDVANGGAEILSAEWNVSPLQGATLPLKVTFDKPVTPSDVQGVTAVLHLTGVDSLGNPVLKELNAALQSVDPNDASSLLFQVTQPMDTDFVGTVSVHAIILDDGVTLTGAGGNADLIFSAIDVGGEWSFNNIQPTIEKVELQTTSFTLSYSEQLIIPANTEINVTKVGTAEIVATFTSEANATQSDTLVFDLATPNGVSLDDLKGGSLVFDVVLGQLLGVDSNNTAKSYYDYDQTTFVDIDGSIHDYDTDTSTWIVAGEFVTTSLVARALSLDGDLIGETVFDPLNGVVNYGALLPQEFDAPFILNVLDGSVELDYLDEFSGQLHDFEETTAGFGLRALIDVNQQQSTQPLYVTPLTEIALRIAESNVNDDLVGAYQAATQNVLALFGLTPIANSVTVITDENFDTSDSIDQAEHIGLVLAALSSMDHVTGSMNATLNLLDPSNGFSQSELDLVIDEAIQAVSVSENPYISDISSELTQVLMHFYDFEIVVLSATSMTSREEREDDSLLDLSDYLADISDYDLLMDGDIQNISQAQDAFVELISDNAAQLTMDASVETLACHDTYDVKTFNDEQTYG